MSGSALLENDSGADEIAAERPTVHRAVARRVILLGLLVGLWGDLAFRVPSRGLNVAVLLLLLTGAVIVLARVRHGHVPATTQQLCIPTVIFALMVATREASLLTVANGVAATTALMLSAAAAGRDPLYGLWRARLGELLWRLWLSVRGSAIGGFVFAFTDARGALAPPPRHRLAALRVLRATGLALALVTPFAVLLAAGDPVFGRLAARITTFQLNQLPSHFILTCLWAVPVVGFLSESFLANPVPRPRAEWLRSLGRLDVIAALGSVSVLFLLFLLVQLRALYGGIAYVQSTTGLTLAEYARSGFFALEVAAGLALAVLLALRAMLREDAVDAVPTYRTLALLLIGLIGPVLLSAASRMLLYVRFFGLSADRLYALVAMLWIAVVLVQFSRTVLQAREQRFVRRALMLAWVTLLTLDLVNPEALVVNYNARRSVTAGGTPFDLGYHALQLSADAIPAVIAAVIEGGVATHAAPQAEPACGVISRLVTERLATLDASGLGQSLSGMRAAAAIRRNRTALLRLSCATPPAPPVEAAPATR